MNPNPRISGSARIWAASLLVPAVIALSVAIASAVEGGVECDVVIAVKSSPADLGSMQFRLDYGSTSGWIAGHGNEPDCTILLGAALSAFSDDEKDKALRGGFASIDGIAAPADIASCVFRGNSIPDAGDFDLVVEDAANLDSQPIDPQPTLEVTVLDCQPIDSLTTTTTTTTTTTLPPCGNWDVVLGIPSAPKPVGSLQVHVDYAAADGEMVGAGSAISCAGLIEGGIVAANHIRSSKRFTVGLVSIDGVAQGSDYASCLFSGTWADPPVAEDFVVIVQASDDTDGQPQQVTVSVTPSAVTVEGQCEERCGDGVVVAPQETCDDANDSETDACPGNCRTAKCGDGRVYEGVELCDDANGNNTDDCLYSCTPASCGDGFVHAGVEPCDDGNASDTDACVSDCVLAECGDEFVQESVEDCDDGGTTSGDGCSKSCHFEQDCGDAIGDGDIKAGDALRILQRAVGLPVECPAWVCDVNETGAVTVVDALAVLRLSVELASPIHCSEAP